MWTDIIKHISSNIYHQTYIIKALYDEDIIRLGKRKGEWCSRCQPTLQGVTAPQVT